MNLFFVNGRLFLSIKLINKIGYSLSLLRFYKNITSAFVGELDNLWQIKVEGCLQTILGCGFKTKINK